MQIGRALEAGIDLTHIDTHMGTVAHPKLIPGYIQLATRYHLPPMIPPLTASELISVADVDDETAQMLTGMIDMLKKIDLPLLDELSGLDLVEPEGRLEQAKAALSALKPGLTHFIIHPAKDTPELRQITPSWACRVADYETFTNDAMRDFIFLQPTQVEHAPSVGWDGCRC